MEASCRGRGHRCTCGGSGGKPTLTDGGTGSLLAGRGLAGRTHGAQLGLAVSAGTKAPAHAAGAGLAGAAARAGPAFSFGRYVFLSPAHTQLITPDYAQLLQYKQVHSTQYHSFDLLLAEVIGWFFWFNGLVPYLRWQLQTVHEYLADATVTRHAGSHCAYGHLLLKLATGPLPVSLVHPFSTKQVALRLQILTNPPSSLMKKLRFLLVIPVATLA
ncbi:hypothetical protein [Hymenobacter psoromatis]|uniref:hypothetical protein n=1 Tax=Hymenobacter psoromatis TaxID=1484116 RepID=UPI001CC05015|nr:hypothetical protein [Hymenobacter psoromatis]